MSYHTNYYQPSGVQIISRQTIPALINIMFLTVLPVLSAAAEHHFVKVGISAALAGKWFIFWTVGVRLLAAGFMQVIRNGRAKSVILLQGDKGEDVAKVLGLAKMFLAALAFLCVMKDNWSLLAALTVGGYIGLAGFQHDFKKPSSQEGWLSMLYDMVVFVVIAACLVF